MPGGAAAAAMEHGDRHDGAHRSVALSSVALCVLPTLRAVASQAVGLQWSGAAMRNAHRAPRTARNGSAIPDMRRP